MSAPSREYDVVVFGITSTVGMEIYKLMATKYTNTKWAIAGRRRGPLEEIAADAARISGRAAPSVIVADVKDPASLRQMAKSTKVILTTVGPFAKFGEGVIEACIAEGCHYADITGEVPWVSKMKKKHGAAAKAAGVHILSLCGYDSIPSELGVYLAAQALKPHGGPKLAESFHMMGGGGFPAGTVETICLGVELAKKQALALLGLSFLLGGKDTKPAKTAGEKPAWSTNEGFVPASEEAALARSSPSAFNVVQWSPQVKAVTPIHFMAPINTSVVHASAAAFGYGGLVYSERLTSTGLWMYTSIWTLYGLIPSALTLLGVGFVGLCAVLGILRPVSKVLNMLINLQAPNTHVTVVATSKDDKARATVTMQYPGDPGILFTSVLCVEVAVALADDTFVAGLTTSAAKEGGGLSTPTMLMGDALLPRLKTAGVQTQVSLREL